MTFQLGPFTPTLGDTFKIFGYGAAAMLTAGGVFGTLAALGDKLTDNRNEGRPHPRSNIELIAMHSFLALGSLFLTAALAMRGFALLSAAITCSVSPSMVQLFEGAKTASHLAVIPLFLAAVMGVLSP